MACPLRNGGRMKNNPQPKASHHKLFGHQPGKLGWIFLWLIGIPIPLLLIFFLIRGCT